MRHCVCGATFDDDYELVAGLLADGRTFSIIKGTCPSCGRTRRIRSYHVRGFEPLVRDFQLSSFPDPSFVFGPHEFLPAVLRADLEADPDTMPPEGYDEAYAINAQALTDINELAKFLPEGADAIPDDAYKGDGWPAARTLHEECYTRAWIERTRARLVEQRGRYEANSSRISALRGPYTPPPPPKLKPFSEASLEAHRLWTRKGGAGQGVRLTVADLDASGLRLGAKELSGLIAERVTFDRTDFSFGTLDACEWTQCSARGAGFGSTRIAGATLVSCNFERAGMTLAKLGDSKIIECTFDGANLDRSTWYRAKVSESSFRNVIFGNAAFDKAVFIECDFRGADFSLLQEDLLGTVFDTLFVQCDLRDTKWAGRSLFRGRFLDCLFAGSSGPPTSVAEVQIENPDLSPDGTGSNGLTRDDLCRYWKMDMDKVKATDDGIRTYWRNRFIADGMDPDEPYHKQRLERFVGHPALSNPAFDAENYDLDTSED